MFIDETVIHVKAGNGGNGCHAHERQPYTPKGRPAGANGGRGGHIYLAASRHIHTLQDMAFKQQYSTERGMHGKGSLKTGKNAVDLTIAIPMGTVVYNDETREVIADCIDEGKPVLAARGGRGGRGNAALATAKNRNPETVEAGGQGEEKRLRLELKVLADVGLVGRPNAGKSTFLSRISRARPKIADYPFTTTEPHLGIVPAGKGYSSFVVADIPGLIENSHKGKGLGIRFLRHIERTKVLAVLIDATSPDPEGDAKILLNELAQYSEGLAGRPRCLIMTKNDCFPKDQPLDLPLDWLSMSAVTGDNVETVLKKLAAMVEETRTAT